MDLAFSHKALSLVQVHTAGHFGFAGFFPQSAEAQIRDIGNKQFFSGDAGISILWLLSDSMQSKNILKHEQGLEFRW